MKKTFKYEMEACHSTLDFEKEIRGTQASQPICKGHRRYVKGLQPQQKSLHKISGCF
jgi:hypothetical protein